MSAGYMHPPLCFLNPPQTENPKENPSARNCTVLLLSWSALFHAFNFPLNFNLCGFLYLTCANVMVIHNYT